MTAVIPPVNTNFLSEKEVLITAYVNGVIPLKSSKSKHEAKNGSVWVIINKQSLDIIVDIVKDEKKLLYKFKAFRLPSPVEPAECTWEVAKNEVRVTIIKSKVGDGDEGSYVDWRPFVFARGLDQWDSSEDEDGTVPDPMPFKLKSEDLPFDVERGKTNEFIVDSDFKF